MKLQINEDYRISSDAQNFILEKKRIAEKGKKAGEEVWSAVGYFGKIEWAFRDCVRRGLMEQDLEGFKNIIEYLDRIDQGIKDLADKLREAETNGREKY